MTHDTCEKWLVRRLHKFEGIMASQSFRLISNQQIICDQFRAGVGKVRGSKRWVVLCGQEKACEGQAGWRGGGLGSRGRQSRSPEGEVWGWAWSLGNRWSSAFLFALCLGSMWLQNLECRYGEKVLMWFKDKPQVAFCFQINTVYLNW